MNERLIIILGIILGVGLFLGFKLDKYSKSIIITSFTKNFIRVILLLNLIPIFEVTKTIQNRSLSEIVELQTSWTITGSWLILNNFILLLFAVFLMSTFFLIERDTYKNLIIYLHYVVYTTFFISFYSLYIRVFEISKAGLVFSIELLCGDWFFIILPLTMSFIFILFKVSKKFQKIDE